MAIIVIPVAQLMSGCVSWRWDSLDSQRMEGAHFGANWQRRKQWGCVEQRASEVTGQVEGRTHTGGKVEGGQR